MNVSVIGTRGFPLIEGGVEKHCEALYPLLRNDIEITVYRRKPYVNNGYKYDNIKFIDLPSTQIKGFETVFHSLLATLHALINKPDVVHYHNIGPAMFSPLLKIRRIPVVLTYHSPNYEHKKWGFFAKTLLKTSEKIAINFSDKIIFVNKFQMQKYSAEIQKKSVYIPNGIKEPVFSENHNYLDDIGVKRGKYVLSVGRITPEKGFDILIKAFRKSAPKGYKLVIAGGVEFENGYMKELKELSKDIPVIFTGYVHGDDLAQLYTNAALYVLASRNEGFPLVLLEAMSYGLDVIVSDIPASHLIRLESEDYFPCGEEDCLSEKLTDKLKDPHMRSYDLRAYRWDKAALDVADICDHAMSFESGRLYRRQLYENFNDK